MDEHIAITVLDRLPLFPVSCYEERYSADFVCLQRITSTVTCRPHLAPRLSAAREGVSSSPLPSESWLDSLPPAKKLSLEVSTRLYTTSPPSEGPGQYPAGILTSPPRAPSLRSFPGPLILSAGAQCPPLSP
ncbi:uncharacterized protein LOC129645921 isoform X16 [Bubalus kerabau]|uniref:uncharacterized protein LOC129645921 isoform X16 n=1 Tax=Bubalus carabanensis TaxID=3119969 RepID=UPI00244E78CA|nr:uncharacterized protein LOC129645921 isoform X16 [Bubalus carabanensis]